MKSALAIVLTACLALTGCVNKNFAKSATLVTIQGEWKQNQGENIFESTRIFRVGNIEFGYLDYGNDPTFTIDPGQKMIKVWYIGNRDSYNPVLLYWQTDLVDLSADLKPNGKYQVRGDYGEKSVRFKLIDLDTQEVIVESSETPIIRRPTGEQPIPPYRK
jgi:hypothetical protein